jgi:hypothetical protein
MYPLRLGGRRWPALIAAWAVAATVLSGCDRTDDPGTPDATTPLSTGQEDSGDPVQNAADSDLAWVPFGPNDPAVPTPSWPAYTHFAQGGCAALQDYLGRVNVGDFGRVMVAVCAAAVDGQQDQWDVAESYAGADPSTLANSCLAGVVQALLDRALAWHRLHPGQTPNVQFQRVEDRMACAPPETEPPESEPPESEPPPQTDPPPTTEGLSHTGDPAEPTR